MKTNTIITILVILAGAIIGYKTNYTNNTLTAAPSPIIKFVKPPILSDGFNLNIDMNSGKVVANASKDISVQIQRKDSIVTRWKTKIVEKPTIIRVKETPKWAMIKSKKTSVRSFAKMPSTPYVVSK